jgi:hypothetical protein
VVGVFQAFVLVPVGFGAMALLWLVGRLAVPVKVAAEWTHGDNPTDKEVANIDALSFLNEPWTRVPVILSAFAVLYLTVQLLTDENHRGYFFSGASAALQQRLALRIAYRLRLHNSSALGRKVKEDTPTAPIATGAAVSAQAPDSEAT